MLDLFQIMDNCNGIGPVVRLVRDGVFPIIQIGIPILLILFGTIDLGKAVIANDDKAIKGATSSLIKRAIAAIAVFFVPFLVSVVFGWIGNATNENGEAVASQGNWFKCWSEEK